MIPIGLIALEVLDYHGKIVVPGEHFLADPAEATTLRLERRAMVASKAERLSYQTRQMVAQ